MHLTRLVQIVCDALSVTDQWLRGTNRKGHFGLFPFNYTEPISVLVRLSALLRVPL